MAGENKKKFQMVSEQLKQEDERQITAAAEDLEVDWLN